MTITRAAMNTQHEKNSGSIAFSGEEKFGLHNIWANKIRGSGFSGQRNSGFIVIFWTNHVFDFRD